MIEIHNVSKTLKGREVLHNISLQINPGEAVGVKGANGSGKTMLLRVIAGLVYPDSGSMLINDIKIGPGTSFPVRLGLLIESPMFPPHYTGLENCRLLASLRNIITTENIERSLKEVGLDPHDKRSFSKYSLGMRQRLGLAVAFMEKPDVILLDEPTNALDEDGVELLKTLVFKNKEHGASIVITSHDEEVLESVSDRIVTMKDGHLLDKTMQQSPCSGIVTSGVVS